MTQEEMFELLKSSDFFAGVKKPKVTIIIEYNTQSYMYYVFSDKSVKDFSKWIDNISQQAKGATNVFLGQIEFRVRAKKYTIHASNLSGKWEYQKKGLFGEPISIIMETPPENARSVVTYFS